MHDLLETTVKNCWILHCPALQLAGSTSCVFELSCMSDFREQNLLSTIDFVKVALATVLHQRAPLHLAVYK
ncbi:hypothetical protein OUZ56_004107 [Daphnia magna]|uniref:Uncharacterized protein n=1 Tax=Daphnia magna TaxID=35525 RepID=A0ABQ9YNR6_9CRUS|nr:hypothetical protein OUZ56_004107 [Daphnia magna]